jgi:hypothetical protein
MKMSEFLGWTQAESQRKSHVHQILLGCPHVFSFRILQAIWYRLGDPAMWSCHKPPILEGWKFMVGLGTVCSWVYHVYQISPKVWDTSTVIESPAGISCSPAISCSLHVFGCRSPAKLIGFALWPSNLIDLIPPGKGLRLLIFSYVPYENCPSHGWFATSRCFVLLEGSSTKTDQNLHKAPSKRMSRCVRSTGWAAA